MEDKITQYLAHLEKERNIKILLACETGSRAWGFPSPDSDYDVRLLYVHQKDWYLSLSEGKDTIDVMLENNDLDFSGWDLRKSLRLLKKSNPPLLERIQSPIIYTCDEDFLSDINEIAKAFYSRIATMHHYLSMSKKCYEEVIAAPEYKLKKLFYALRTAVVCKWITERNDIPPIEFGLLLDGLSIDPEIEKRIAELIALKATISESYLHSGDEAILDFIKTNLEQADAAAPSLPHAKGDVAELDAFFRKHLPS